MIKMFVEIIGIDNWIKLEEKELMFGEEIPVSFLVIVVEPLNGCKKIIWNHVQRFNSENITGSSKIPMRKNQPAMIFSDHRYRSVFSLIQ